MKGTVENHSSKHLWVVNTDTGKAVAFKLAPGWKSNSNTDADGFKAVDGTAIDGYKSWVKIVDIATAEVRDNSDGTLVRGCIACKNVKDDYFGDVEFRIDEWGEPI